MEARRTIIAAVEIAAVIAGVVIGGKYGVMLLLVVASVAIMVRGGRWFEPRDGDRGAAWSALGGMIIGVAALGAAWIASPAIVESVGRDVEWTTEPVVRGSVQLATTVILVTVVLGLAAELVFRRWLLDRIAGAVVARGEPRQVALAAGVIVAAMIEAAVSPTGAGTRVGAVIASGGLGAIYVTSGGRIAACLTARLAFDVGAIIVQALRMTP